MTDSSLDTSRGTHHTNCTQRSSASSLRRPNRRPSIGELNGSIKSNSFIHDESNTESNNANNTMTIRGDGRATNHTDRNPGEFQKSNEEELGLQEVPSAQQDVKTVLKGVMALVTIEDRIGDSHNSRDDDDCDNSGVPHEEEEAYDYPDDENYSYDIDASSRSSDASEKTEVTNNKSITGSFVVNTGGSSRGATGKALSVEGKHQNARLPHRVTSQSDRRAGESTGMHGSVSGLSIRMDSSNQEQQQPRQPEAAGSSCDALPFKGNPSKQRRLEKEKKKRESRRRSLQQQSRAVLSNSNPISGICHQEDEDFDLRSKPGVINVVLEDEETGFLLGGDEDRSHGTAPSRKTAKSTGSTTHTSATSSSSFTLTEERVRSHMKDYYEDYDSIFRYGKSSLECWEAFFRQYFTDDIMWVRSTGNPLNREGLAKLMVEDIVGLSMSIVSIDSIQLLAGGLAAVVVFTADQEYLYKGKGESDRTVITSVLHVANGCEILIGHEHRCVGKPIPKDTRWES